MRRLFYGGVARHQEMGVWTVDRGVPQVVRGRTISQTGWGSREQLLQAAVCSKEPAVPQLWLCGGNGELPPVYQRYVASGVEMRTIRRHGRAAGVASPR